MKDKSTSTFLNLLLLCCFLLFNVNKLTAQENEVIEISYEDNSSSENLKKEKDKNSRVEFNNLSQQLHATHYIEKNNLKNTYGNGQPIRITLEDANSFDFIKNDITKYNQVEIISIVLNSENDLSKTLDIDTLNGLNKLKYIFIKCNFDCTDKQIKKLVKKSNQKVRVFYSINKAS